MVYFTIGLLLSRELKKLETELLLISAAAFNRFKSLVDVTLVPFLPLLVECYFFGNFWLCAFVPARVTVMAATGDTPDEINLESEALE